MRSWQLPDASVVDRYVRRATRRLGMKPRSSRQFDRTLANEDIDALFVSWAEFDTPVAVPLLGWIHDFQHKHLPELFSVQGERAAGRPVRASVGE